MSEVHAIKDPGQVKQVQEFLLKHYGTHFSDMWILGINVALRISDLLNISMLDAKKAVKERHMFILEQKTAYKTINKGTANEERIRTKVKPRFIELNQTAAEIMIDRIESYPNDKWLFQSHGNRGKSLEKPYSRQAVYYAFKEAGESIGVSIGTHTLRKTAGYAMHKAGVPIEEICFFLNHSHISVTMKYIGLQRENLQKLYHRFEMKFD